MIDKWCNMENINSRYLELEINRINNSNWLDLTQDELSLITDKDKKRKYQNQINQLYMQFLNSFAMLVGNDFSFSKPKELLTYRIMMTDYMNYFYNKGMTREEIIQMILENKEGKRK